MEVTWASVRWKEAGTGGKSLKYQFGASSAKFESCSKGMEMPQETKSLLTKIADIIRGFMGTCLSVGVYINFLVWIFHSNLPLQQK